MLLTSVLLLIIVCEIWGITAVERKHLLKSMIYYTQLSNVAALFSAACLLLFGPQEWVVSFRYLAVCMLVMTCLVTVFVLQPLLKNSLNVISYIFLETPAKGAALYLPPAVTLLYGIIMLYMNYIEKIDGPYPFLRIRNQTRTATVMWILVLLAAVTAISTAVLHAAG